MKVIYLPFPSSYYKRILSTNRSIIILCTTKNQLLVDVGANITKVLLIKKITNPQT